MIYDADDERVGMMNNGTSTSRSTFRDFGGRILRESEEKTSRNLALALEAA